MSERQERLQNRLQPEIREFRDGCRTLQLATVDGEGNPNASYAPFVLQEDGYYVLISEIARHARNLQQVPKVSLMLIEDETGARELFARKRLTFDAVAEVVARDDARWEKAVAALEGRFGEIVKGLSNLKDFVLFRLKPEQGLFVKGFGQAFRVSGDELVDFVHLVEGHKRIDNGAELTSPADEPVRGDNQRDEKRAAWAARFVVMSRVTPASLLGWGRHRDRPGWRSRCIPRGSSRRSG